MSWSRLARRTCYDVYGYGAANLVLRDGNLLTTFAYDPSGNTIARSVSVGTAAIGLVGPDDVALYDGYGYPADVVTETPRYVFATGPTSYGAGIGDRGGGGQ